MTLLRLIKRDGSLSERRFDRHSASEMHVRRDRNAGGTPHVYNLSFRTTGISAYLMNRRPFPGERINQRVR